MCNSHPKKIRSLNRSLPASPSIPRLLSVSSQQAGGQPGHSSHLLLSSPPHLPSQAEASWVLGLSLPVTADHDWRESLPNPSRSQGLWRDCSGSSTGRRPQKGRVGPRFQPTLRGGGKEHRCSSILLPCKEKVTRPVTPPHACCQRSHGRLIPLPVKGEARAVRGYSQGRVLAGSVTQASAGRAGGSVQECVPLGLGAGVVTGLGARTSV